MRVEQGLNIALSALIVGYGCTSRPVTFADIEKSKFTPTPNTLIVPPERATLIPIDIYPAQEKILPTELVASQKRLVAEYQVITSDGRESIIPISIGGTLIASRDDFVIISVGHAFGWKSVGKMFDKYLEKKYGRKNIPIQNPSKLKNIIVDDVKFNRKDFGYSFEDNLENDIAVFVINKSVLNEELLNQFENDALDFKAISFGNPNTSDSYLGTCSPVNNTLEDVIALDARLLPDKFRNYLYIGPFNVSPGCSGYVLATQNKDGVKLNGVIIGTHMSDGVVYSIVNPFSNTSELGLRRGIYLAKEDRTKQTTNEFTYFKFE